MFLENRINGETCITAVNGFALGVAVNYLCVDIRIASEKAKFGQPEVGLGIIPGFVYPNLHV